MTNDVRRQQFQFNSNIVTSKFGPDAFVVSIREGDMNHDLNASVTNYQILDEVPLADIGGSVTKTLAIKWEDGVVRTQTVIERLKLSSYKAVIAHQESKVA